MKSLILTYRYIRYFFNSDTRHNIHSPFVYSLITEVLCRNDEHPVFQKIESLRRRMLGDDSLVKIRDFGAGFEGKKYVEKKVSFIASHSCKSQKYSRLLHRLASYFRPSVILELGTSVGVSGMYLASAVPDSEMTTMEGCENTALIAKSNFIEAGLRNVRVETGDFDSLLPAYLSESRPLDLVFIDGNHRMEPLLRYFNACVGKAHANSCFVIDDINWSDEMKEAWNVILKHPKVYVTIDLFMLGLVFFNSDHSKQNFTIRF